MACRSLHLGFAYHSERYLSIVSVLRGSPNPTISNEEPLSGHNTFFDMETEFIHVVSDFIAAHATGDAEGAEGAEATRA